jgi:serine phosphatase RsbU (regulator of sigma subunit)
VKPNVVRKAVGEYRFPEYLEVHRAISGPDGAVIGHTAVTLSLPPENRRFARIRWLILAVSLGVALGTAALLSATVRYQVVSPLERLARSARALRQEGVHQPVVVNTEDEIGELSRAFNRMGQAVVERAKYLQNELEIAARIQTSILPRGLDVPGLELCALMRPAAEAGGDYYEVLPTSDGAWLGIGDVTGHGLNAGLTMMMLQGMVSALVKQNENASPAALLANANRALYENVRERLGTDDHVTLTLLRYRQDGRVTCAGAHLPIVVVRAQDHQIEEHEVDGVWSAITREVAELNPEQNLVLEPGDLMVLYTDGIEEALDGKGEMFGTPRFHAALLEVIDQPLNEIVSHIIEVAVRWCGTPQDDMTIMVARQKEPTLPESLPHRALDSD